MWYWLGLGVRVPAASLFRDENFVFFDFGVRGTPKTLEIFFGVPPEVLKKVWVLPCAIKCFAHFFQNFERNPYEKFLNFGVFTHMAVKTNSATLDDTVHSKHRGDGLVFFRFLCNEHHLLF